jgi:hypothetical protein
MFQIWAKNKKKSPAAEQSQVRKLKEIGDLGTRLCRCNSSHVRCIVSSEAPTSPPRLPRCTAWPLSLHLSSRSWHLVRLAGGHHRLRDLSIMFPGEFLLRDWDLDCDTLSLFFFISRSYADFGGTCGETFVFFDKLVETFVDLLYDSQSRDMNRFQA